jgi:hypothetical protein
VVDKSFPFEDNMYLMRDISLGKAIFVGVEENGVTNEDMVLLKIDGIKINSENGEEDSFVFAFARGLAEEVFGNLLKGIDDGS